MGIFVGIEDVAHESEHSQFNFCAEASSLGWAPGFFPEIVETDLGNGRMLFRKSLDSGSAVYEQNVGCIKLTVFND